MKIFIDTNTFLDFYQSTHEPINILKDLNKNCKHFVLTEQSIDEFERNRDRIIERLISQVDKSIAFTPHTTSIVRQHKKFEKIVEKKKELEELRKEIVVDLNKLLSLKTPDPVRKAFLDIYSKSEVFEIDDDVYQRAQRRRLLGNPPRSSNKDTIADEAHWESLLKFSKYDLVLLTRDDTFHQNGRFLETEYKSKTGYTVKLITRSISEALGKVGVSTSDETKEYDDEQLLKQEEPLTLLIPNDWELVEVLGDFATVRRSGFTGWTPIRNIDPSYSCPHCGQYGPWSGTICLSCGIRSTSEE